jgi:RimJ/RimL family protein N-acetyltransferase
MSNVAIPGLRIRGEKVGFRPLEEGDAERCYIWFNDGEILRFINDQFPKTHTFELEWLKKYGVSRDDVTMSLLELVSGKHIGNGGLHQIDWQNRCATMGLVIGDKEAQNKGYGTEAEKLLMEFGFMVLNLERIQASVIGNNPRSRKVAERVGFKLEGARRRRYYREGEWYDENLFGILKTEWLAM